MRTSKHSTSPVSRLKSAPGAVFLARLVVGVLAFVMAAAVTTSCLSTHFDGITYRSKDINFTVAEKPANWRGLSVSDALIAYHDDVSHATIAVNGRCGKDGDDVPLAALTQHLFIYFTEREIIDQKTVPLDGREALRTELVAKLDGVARGFVVYVLKKDGCVYDFLFVGEPGLAGHDDFDDYVMSFRTGLARR